jgi:hypothetical protein
MSALLLLAAAASDLTICAARPGKSTPACTVPAGHFQLETGLIDWSLRREGGERDTSLVIGETTFKYGLTGHSDLELDVTPWQRLASRAGGIHDRASGFGDLVISYKHRLSSLDAAVQFALLPFVKLPTAKRSLGNSKLDGGLLAPIGFAIGKSPFSLGLTPEFDWTADADRKGHHPGMVQVVSLGWQASDRLTVSGDLWGQWDWDPAGTTRQYSADVSAAYLVRPDLQLDAGANFGLNRATPDIEVYSGVSILF